jgi:hypothetical protein
MENYVVLVKSATASRPRWLKCGKPKARHFSVSKGKRVQKNMKSGFSSIFLVKKKNLRKLKNI